MEYLTISQVTKTYDVTPRMLRYYEKLGLIETSHKEGYAYRLYDEKAVNCIQQIIILKKLRIPLKQAAVILQNKDMQNILKIFQDVLKETNDEIAALQSIRRVLSVFESRIKSGIYQNGSFDLLGDKELMELVNALAVPKTTIKENVSMEELNKANEVLSKKLNVRIVQLPPFTAASYQYIGENPEDKVGDMMFRFIQESRLYEIKPDSRLFGFNHPNPGILENGLYGYEDWVTIPDDMELKEPLVKKKFPGGLFAVTSMTFPDFHVWQELAQWVQESGIYEERYDPKGEEIMGGCLEEHLSWVYAAHMGWTDECKENFRQLDLMFPIKRKDKTLTV